CALASLLLALERRRITHPKAQHYADFQCTITAGISDRRNGGWGVSLQGTNPEPLMSALGQKQTFGPRNAMSALPPKADIAEHRRYVCFVPIADINPLDQFVRHRKHSRRDWRPRRASETSRTPVFGDVTNAGVGCETFTLSCQRPHFFLGIGSIALLGA